MVTLDGEVGVELRWTRSPAGRNLRRFSLIMTVAELLNRGYGGVDPLDLATADLRLAVQEPHAETHEGVREIFRSIP
ncbi:hypothetical protein [Humibacillus xanthopallidus]|uniref:hypothetical protein n=1 Tax=Humibacillus xanthopallidus TaxID=412689 RepID=UPI001152C605|nr:hypothetical protein [Humibacillus xanthopallidus]